MSRSSLTLYNKPRLLLRFNVSESANEPIERLSSEVSRCKLPVLMIFLSENVFVSILRIHVRYSDVRSRFVVAVYTVAHIVETFRAPIDS